MNAISGARVEAADEVDNLVDALIEDPSKAEDVKAALRRRITEPQVVSFTKGKGAGAVDSKDDDTFDLWDNVPV